MNAQEYIVDHEITILEAMQRLEQTSARALFITKEGKLEAVVSDGDVRRWLISGGDIKEKVSCCANYKPKYLINESDEYARIFLKENSIEVVPIVDENMHIKRVVRWNQDVAKILRQPINLPVVMMAGGMGKRLYPYTKILPKPLIPIGEIPISEHIINQFREYGCEDYYLIVNYKRKMIKAYFSDVAKDYNVFYVDEETPLGTGGGLSLLKGRINSTFILTNCDILIREDFSKIYKYHMEQSNIITMVCALQNIQIPYGVVNISNGGQIDSMEEKPILSFLTNTGCYIVEAEVIDEIQVNTAIDFPDIIDKYRKQGKKVGAYPIGQDAWMDMGQMDEFEKMRKRMEC